MTRTTLFGGGVPQSEYAGQRREATEQRAQCQRQQGHALLNREFTLIQTSTIFFVILRGLKYRLCFGIPIVDFFGEFGI